jgi:hypothetical protein
VLPLIRNQGDSLLVERNKGVATQPFPLVGDEAVSEIPSRVENRYPGIRSRPMDGDVVRIEQGFEGSGNILLSELVDAKACFFRRGKLSVPGGTTLSGCPMFAPAYVGRIRWAKPYNGFMPAAEKHWKKDVFGPRIPDFLSRLVALSNFMRLSLRESRIRGHGKCSVVGNPGNASANVGDPDSALARQGSGVTDATVCHWALFVPLPLNT